MADTQPAKAEGSAPDRSLLQVLADLSLAVRALGTSLSELEALKSNHLSFDEWLILQRISRESGRSASLIARACGLSRQRFQQITAELESRGLIAGVPAEQNRRQKIFSLTPAGQHILEAADAGADALDSEGVRKSRQVTSATRQISKLNRRIAVSLGLRSPKPKADADASAAAGKTG